MRTFILTILTALILPACLPAAEVPRALVENALNAQYPHTKAIALRCDERLTPEGDFVVECRAKRECTEATYRPAPDLDDGHGQRRSALVVACIRAGLVAARDVPRLGPESLLDFNPYLEPTLAPLTMLERCHPAGTVFEVSGIVRARRNGQGWSVSAFEPANADGQPGQSLAEFCDPGCSEALYPSLPRSGPAHYIVAGSREWRDLVAEMRVIRNRRWARLEKHEAALRVLLRPGAEYWIETSIGGSDPNQVPAKVTFPTDSTMQIQRPTHPQWTRAFRLGEMQRDVGGTGDSAATRYQRFPDVAPRIRVDPLSAAPPEDGGRIFGEPPPTFDLTLRGGQLLLIHRESGHCHPLERHPPATTRATQQDQCPPIASPYRRPALKQAQTRR